MALIASRVMAKAPFGLPKVIATPAAMPTYIAEWFGALDVVVMQVIMEFAGMNNLVTTAIAQVGGAISGMVEEAFDYTSLKLPYPSIAITQIGFNEECAVRGKKAPRRKGLQRLSIPCERHKRQEYGAADRTGLSARPHRYRARRAY